MTLLFDLDGTLVDSAQGIRKSLQKGLESLGVAIPKPEVLDSVIGQTFHQIWPKLTGSDKPEDWEIATMAFRAHYDAGAWMQVSWMPGMQEALVRLKKQVTCLGIATMKPSAAAVKVLQHLGGHEHFDFILGAADAGEMIVRGKGAAIAHSLKSQQCRLPGMLVGDRAEDLAAAKECGLTSVAVTWGHGSLEELQGADHVIDTVEQLEALIMRSVNV